MPVVASRSGVRMNDSKINWFINWEEASRDTIDVKKVYIDLAGDLVAGVLLSQIIYWHLPKSRRRSESKLQVERDDHLWLAKAHAEWWDECRLSIKQVKRALKILVQRELIIVAYYQFAGMRTTHIRIDWDHFLPQLEAMLEGTTGENKRDRPVGTKGTDRSGLNGTTGENLKDQPYTEITSKDYKAKKTAKTTPPTPADFTEEVDTDETTLGGGVITSEGIDVYSFLTNKCGVWDKKARQLASRDYVSLELVAHWWAVLKSDENIRNRAAVLVHHLENGDNPPDFTDSRQRLHFEQYLWEYTADEDLEDGDCGVGE